MGVLLEHITYTHGDHLFSLSLVQDGTNSYRFIVDYDNDKTKEHFLYTLEDKYIDSIYVHWHTQDHILSLSENHNLEDNGFNKHVKDEMKYG